MSLSRLLLFAALSCSLTAQWTELSPAVKPSARFQHGMVLDQTRDVVVLFGGNASGSGSALGDTWEWDGNTWTQKFPQNSPSARWAHCMAWDSLTGHVILFGGDDVATLPGNSQNDTWSYDGTDWTQLSPATSPGNRSYSNCATDVVRQRIVLFGGWDTSDPNTPIIGGTWEWDGNTWIERFPAFTPSNRREPAMGYSLVDGVTVLNGGYDGNIVLGDTWTWDGTEWTQDLTATSNGDRQGHQLIFEPTASNGSTWGGNSGNIVTGVYSDTWQWVRDTNWIQTAGGQSSAAHPAGSSRYGMAKRPGATRGVVTFGGMIFSITPPTIGFVALDDMWQYEPTRLASSAPLGPGCPGSNGTPTLSVTSVPSVGSDFDLAVDNMPSGGGGIMAFGFSNTSFAGFSLPLSLGVYGMPGCFGYVSVDTNLFFTATGSTGTVSLPVPFDVSFAGLSLYSQAFVIDAAAGNNAGATVSNGALGIVGL